jgi:hypothetical protein
MARVEIFKGTRSKGGKIWGVLGRLIRAGSGIVFLAGTVVSPGVQADLADLLPKPADWTKTEEVQRFKPESLFEYINGAAESYIGYEFRELVVGQYQVKNGKATMTAEIYDLATPRNAFGIYGSERFAESRFLPIGVQGYLEEGTLNFLAGRYYVKLLCFEGGAAADGYLKRFAADILKSIPEVGGFPPELDAFPKDGLVANSEKFILSNVLGFKFLSNGFVAVYRADGREFDAFIIEARSAEDAADMLRRLLDQLVKGGSSAVKTDLGVRIKDPYLATIVLALAGRHLCGATKIKDGGEAAGETRVAAMAKGLESR